MRAEKINQKHREVVALGRTVKEIAAEIGEELIAVKNSPDIKHGQFKSWVERNCDLSVRRAQEYMKVARAKNADARAFVRCETIQDVLTIGKAEKTPKPDTRAATLDDLRKVEKLRAQRDCPTSNEAVREACQRKLDELEQEIGKVEPDLSKAKQHVVYTDLANEATEIVLSGVFENRRAFEIIQNALMKTYGDDEARLKRLIAVLKSYQKH